MKIAMPWHNPDLNWSNHTQMSMNGLAPSIGVVLLTLGYVQTDDPRTGAW